MYLSTDYRLPPNDSYTMHNIDNENLFHNGLKDCVRIKSMTYDNQDQSFGYYAYISETQVPGLLPSFHDRSIPLEIALPRYLVTITYGVI